MSAACAGGGVAPWKCIASRPLPLLCSVPSGGGETSLGLVSVAGNPRDPLGWRRRNDLPFSLRCRLTDNLNRPRSHSPNLTRAFRPPSRDQRGGRRRRQDGGGARWTGEGVENSALVRSFVISLTLHLIKGWSSCSRPRVRVDASRTCAQSTARPHRKEGVSGSERLCSRFFNAQSLRLRRHFLSSLFLSLR